MKVFSYWVYLCKKNEYVIGANCQELHRDGKSCYPFLSFCYAARRATTRDCPYKKTIPLLSGLFFMVATAIKEQFWNFNNHKNESNDLNDSNELNERTNYE